MFLCGGGHETARGEDRMPLATGATGLNVSQWIGNRKSIRWKVDVVKMITRLWEHVTAR